MRLVLMLAISVASLSGCGGPAVCTASGLAAALEGAAPGDVVELEACTVEGAFVVPDGVTLEGVPGSVLASVEGGQPVLRTTTATEVTLRGLAIEVRHGGVGVRVDGTGMAHLESLTLEVSRGIGVGLDACSASLDGVSLDGPVDAGNAISTSLSPDETGAYGIVGRSLEGQTVTLRDVHVAGFAVAGATFGGGTIDWEGRDDGPDVEATRGLGIALFGGTATLSSVEVVGMLSAPTLTTSGIAAIGELDVTASGLVVRDGDGFGLFSEGADVEVTGGTFTDLGLSALRIQRGSLLATGLTVTGNGGAGILAIDASSVTVEDADIDGQRLVRLPSGITSVEVGDGIEVVRDETSTDAPALSLRLIDVRMSGNARTGLLIDAADGPVDSVVLERIAVDAPDGATGAIRQRTAVPAGWDDMVTRSGAAIDDATFGGRYDSVGIMMPPGIVPPPF